ncbi:hypothetical protein WYI_13862 [Ochrobactrum sp. CDB2]|nr:hypothetical protein WYI_13862 [Ochrobactrum sp. CDB2]
MHSTYQITGNDLARAFAGIAQTVNKPAPKARTLWDVCRQVKRGGHTATSLEFLAGIMPETEFETAMARLDRVIERQASFGKAKHWSYDQCRHLALLEHRQKLLDFASGEAFLEAAE